MANYIEKTFTARDFVSSIADKDIRLMRAAIAEFWPRVDIDDYFGLPYTSSSSFAGLWNTNTRCVFDQAAPAFTVRGFALSRSGEIVAIVQSDDEKEKHFVIGRIFHTVAELRAANTAAGMFFFSRDTMRLFKSKVESGIYAGRYFVTSEDFGQGRQYKVRAAGLDADIKTLSDHKTLAGARMMAKQYAGLVYQRAELSEKFR